MQDQLPDAEQTYRETLGGLGTIVDFDLSGLDRLGVPVTSCSLAVDGRLVHHGNGYGATERDAILSGLGELAEGVVPELALRRAEYEVATRSELVRRLGDDGVIDPRRLCLPAGCDYDDDQRLTWVALRRLRDEASVLVPMEFLASEPDELPTGGPAARSLIVPITNGLGAGFDPQRAIGHGIGEIVQRHTNGLRFRALDSRSPVLDPAGLPASVTALLARFAEADIAVSIKHAGTAYGMFSCYAVGLDTELDDPIRLTACGEAADPSPERAMIKAVLEYANSRARKAFCFGANPAIATTAPAAYWQQLPQADGETRAVEAMQSWADRPAEELRRLTEPDLGRQVSPAEVAPPVVRPDADPLGWQLGQLNGHDVLSGVHRVGEVWAAKTVITELEVETLSYGRIGETNARACIEADLGLVLVGPTGTERHPDRISLTPEAEERLGGPAWFSPARAAEIVGPLYPLYREPPRHAVSVGSVSSPAVRRTAGANR